MIDKIKQLPWLQIAGFAVVGIIGWAVLRKVSAIESVAQTPGQTTPLFMAGTGSMLSPSPPGTPVLGGESWDIPIPQLGGDESLAISNNEKEVALANIAAQQAIAQKGFEILMRPETSTNNTGNLGTSLLPPSIQDQYNTPLQYPTGGRPSTFEATAFAAQKVASGDYFGIYDAAKKIGYSAQDTATILNRAYEASGHKQVITAADVNQWASDRGLQKLQ